MVKEILLYGVVDKDSAVQFINQLNDASEEDISVRVNTPGGSVPFNYGMIAKFAEHKKNKNVMVDGMAASAGFYFCVNADYVECLDVTDFMLHRAAYPSWIENNPDYFDDGMRASLNRINAKFQKAVSNKLDIDSIQEIMDSKPELNGAKFKNIFSLDSRIDVWLTAKEAKKIGLVNKIINITPAKREEIKAHMDLIAAQFTDAPNTKLPNAVKPKENKIMDLITLKNTHPSVYAEIIALGKAEGIAAEKDRVEAWLEFNDIDPKAVADGVASGKAPTLKSISEFSKKAMAKDTVTAAAAEAAPKIVTPVAADITANMTPEEKAKKAELDAFNAETKALLDQKVKVGSNN